VFLGFLMILQGSVHQGLSEGGDSKRRDPDKQLPFCIPNASIVIIKNEMEKKGYNLTVMFSALTSMRTRR